MWTQNEVRLTYVTKYSHTQWESCKRDLNTKYTKNRPNIVCKLSHRWHQTNRQFNSMSEVGGSGALPEKFTTKLKRIFEKYDITGQEGAGGLATSLKRNRALGGCDESFTRFIALHRESNLGIFAPADNVGIYAENLEWNVKLYYWIDEFPCEISFCLVS